MAVKEIKNPKIPGPNQVTSVNRAKETSMKDYKNRSGNKEQSVKPGKNASKNYSIDIKDVDSVIVHHVKNVMNLKVIENGELVSVPVLYGNSERWANVRRQGYLRDKNGTLQLPLLMLKRTSIDRNELSNQGFEHDLQGEHIQIVRSSNWSKDNYYDNFAVQQNNKPNRDIVVTGMPQFIDVSYDFVVWTHYMEQMNSITQNFITQSNKYWGNTGDYRFLCKIGGALNDATELNQDSERIVKLEFSISLSGYLIPETISNVISKKTFNAKRILSPKHVTFKEKVNL